MTAADIVVVLAAIGALNLAGMLALVAVIAWEGRGRRAGRRTLDVGGTRRPWGGA